MEEKYYYLMALFDEKTNNYFHLLKSYIDLPANPSSIFLPHLTLGAYMKVDEDELCHWIEGQCKKLHQVVLNFNHLGLFALKVFKCINSFTNAMIMIMERLDTTIRFTQIIGSHM